MSYEQLQIGGNPVPVLSWTNHALSSDETNMLRNTSRLPCVFHHVALMAAGCYFEEQQTEHPKL